MNPGCHRLLIGPAGTILCAARGICRALGALVLFACAAQASDWPTRPITAVVPYAAGGNTDTMARMVGERLTAALGQPVVVENVAGASGAIGAARVAHASPDGNTLLFASASQIIIAPLVQKTSYDPQKDFVPVSIFGAGPYILGIKPSLPASTFREFIAYAQSNPGKLNYASAGPGGIIHLDDRIARLARRHPHDARALQERRSRPQWPPDRRDRRVFRQCIRVAAAGLERPRQAARGVLGRAPEATPGHADRRRVLSRLSRHLVERLFLRRLERRNRLSGCWRGRRATRPRMLRSPIACSSSGSNRAAPIRRNSPRSFAPSGTSIARPRRPPAPKRNNPAVWRRRRGQVARLLRRMRLGVERRRRSVAAFFQPGFVR